MTRFVVCGETLIDLVPAEGAVDDSFRSMWQALSAGGPMNSAVALGKLGADVHFLGRLSNDAFGAQLRRHILGSNVALDLATESSQPTSIAVVSLDDGGVASYTFHFSETANFGWQADDLPTLKAEDWLHIASLSCVVNPGAAVLLDWMRRVPSGVSYDINVRPTVITLGPGGGAAVEPGGKITRVNGFPTKVVDTVGAGDTFMAGFLDGRVKLGTDLESSLRRGAAAASIVCSRRGAQPPTSAEVDALIAAD